MNERRHESHVESVDVPLPRQPRSALCGAALKMDGRVDFSSRKTSIHLLGFGDSEGWLSSHRGAVSDMDATLEDVQRWKMMNGRPTGVEAIDLHVAKVRDVVERLRQTGAREREGVCDPMRDCLVHESMPTTDERLIGIRSLFELFSRELSDALAGPAEPGMDDSAAGIAHDELDAAETVGLVRSEHGLGHDDDRLTDLNVDGSPQNVLETVFELPATRLDEFASPLTKCDSREKWRDAIKLLDERDSHALFFSIEENDQCIECVVTAEDIIHFLGVEQTLHRAVGACFDESILFDSVRDTFIVVHQEHNFNITAADCFLWLRKEAVNAVVYVESSFWGRVPGEQDVHGHLLCELSIRDVLDLNPDNFVDIFNVDPVAYVSSKPRLHGVCRAVFVEGVSGSTTDSARRAIEKFAAKRPRRLPRRFYVIHDEHVRACTPLSILRTILCDASDRQRA